MTYRLDWRVEPRAGEYIGRGIASFGEAMGQGLAKGAEVQAAQKERDRQLKEQSDRYGSIMEAMGAGPGEVASMSLGQKMGAVDAITLKRAEEIRRQQHDETERFRRAMGMTTTASGGPTIPMVEAMNRAGVTDPALRESGLSTQEAMGGASDITSAFEEDPVSGYRFVRHGRQILPSGMNPTLAEAMDREPRFKQAPDGSWIAIDARGGVTQLRGAAEDKPRSMGDIAMSSAGNFVEKIKALHAVNDTLQKVTAAPADKNYGWPWKRKTRGEYLAELNQRRISAVRELDAAGVKLHGDGTLRIGGRVIDTLDNVAGVAQPEPDQAGAAVQRPAVIDFNSLP